MSESDAIDRQRPAPGNSGVMPRFLVALSMLSVLASCGGGLGSGGDGGGGSGDVPVRSTLAPLCQAQPAAAVARASVAPSDTGVGIGAAAFQDRHYVVAPSDPALRKNRLLLFLGGATTVTDSYNDISDFAAAVDNLGVIDLSYPNDTVPLFCGNAGGCADSFHGEVLFGQGVAYSPNARTWSTAAVAVSKEDSIVNRFVNLIDYLANPPASAVLPANFPPAAYWTQFVTPDAASPYRTAHLGGVYPVWSKILLAGHSLGSGHAAFLATQLPSGGPLHRVVLFSGPDDSTDAAWLFAPTVTPMNRFWGLRGDSEGAIGANTSANWASLGGPGNGGVGGSAQAVDRNVGPGNGDPQGQQRLVANASHNGTAIDSSCRPEIGAAWDYVFTGNSSD